MSARRNILLLLQPKSVNPYAHLRHGLSHLGMTRIRLYIQVVSIQDISDNICTTQIDKWKRVAKGSAPFSLCVKAVVGGKSSFRFEKGNTFVITTFAPNH